MWKDEAVEGNEDDGKRYMYVFLTHDVLARRAMRIE